MSLWPKSLTLLLTNFLTARTGARLKKRKQAIPDQTAAFRTLLSGLSRASYWKSKGIDRKMTYDRFRSTIPLALYDDLVFSIDRMKRGEPNILWPGQCAYFAVSSGTTGGRTKYFPMTADAIRHFRRSARDSLMAYALRTKGTKLFSGRMLFSGSSTALTRLEDSLPFEAWSGGASGILSLNLPAWAKEHLYEPSSALSEMTDWAEKTEAIADAMIGKDLSLVAGVPSWVLILADSVRSKASVGKKPVQNLEEVWPHLECFVHGGVPIAPFHDELKATFGPNVKFHEVYAATEAFIAVQDASGSAGLRLLTDRGVFYEFLPMSEFNEARIQTQGPRAVPLAQIQTNTDYAIIVTTPGGLARYVVGDVVRFITSEPPRLIYVGRTKLLLSSFGEHVIEKEITDTLVAVCRRNGWTIVNFHVGPANPDPAVTHPKGKHEWWIELRPGTRITPTGTLMAPEIDTELMRVNEDYRNKRKAGQLDAPLVRLVMPGVFEHWQKTQHKWGGQNKMPRCRSDRLVADQLAKIAHFAEDQ